MPNCYDCGSSPYNTLKRSSSELSGMEHDLAMLKDISHSHSDTSTDNHYAKDETTATKYGILEPMDKYNLDLKKEEENKNPWDSNTLDKQLEERDILESHTSAMQLESHERMPLENLMLDSLSDSDRDTIERTAKSRG